MHILVYEGSQNLTVAPSLGVGSPVANIITPLLRPRLTGARGALRGDAYNARLADSARVLFTVRLPQGGNDLFNNYRATITLFQSPLLGQDPTASYQNLVKDVTGYFAVDGQIVLDVSLYAVNRVQLQLVRITNATIPGPTPNSLFCLTQILAEEAALDIEDVLRDKGET